MNYTAQGSITITRLRNGDSLFLNLNVLDMPLYQGINNENGAVSPDWKNGEKQPRIVPTVVSARGDSVSTKDHLWKYNGILLTFSAPASGKEWGANTNSGINGKFEMKYSSGKQTGEIRIVDNLASRDNNGNDTLEYSCKAEIGKMSYPLSQSIDILIQPIGATAHQGFIMTANPTLTNQNKEAVLNTKLLGSGEEVSNYFVKWFNGAGTRIPTTPDGAKSLTVTRDNVNWIELFTAEFYLGNSAPLAGATPVAKSGIRITDIADEYKIVLTASPSTEVAPGSDVTITAKVINTQTGAVVAPASGVSPTWTFRVMRNWTERRNYSGPSNVFAVTCVDTDCGTGDINDGVQYDVEILVSATWN